MPDLSVVIPTFNRRRLVADAIASALGLVPLGVRLQVIVVDDFSSDDTWPWLQTIASDVVRVLRTPANGGQCTARNLGLKEAGGRYVLFLDSDDLLEPAVISEGVTAMDDSGADIAVFGWGAIDEAESAASSRRHYEASHFSNVVDDLLRGYGPATSAGLYRRRYVDGLQWDESLRKLDDWDWFCQAALRNGTIITLPKIAYWVRDHGGPRVTNRSSMLLNAHEHHAILRKIERHLVRKGELTEPRRKRLAKYYYKELRVLCLYDRAAFEAAMAHIHDLDPTFTPQAEERQWWMRFAGRVLGTRRSLLAHSALKRLVRRA